MELCEFESSLVYIASSSQDYIETLSPKQNKSQEIRFSLERMRVCTGRGQQRQNNRQTRANKSVRWSHKREGAFRTAVHLGSESYHTPEITVSTVVSLGFKVQL